jgi:hypothetical protein
MQQICEMGFECNADLFASMPVRFKELQRNIKRE